MALADDLYGPRSHGGGGPMIEKLPRGLVLDSLWHRTSIASGVCRVLNREDRWIAECVWVYSESPPGGIHTMEQMSEMADQPGFDPSARMTAARYRWMVKAKSLDEAKAAALRDRPAKVPAGVRHLLLAQARQPAACPPDSAASPPAK